MVYAGKPSAGCEPCRYVLGYLLRIERSLTICLPSKAKKRCDQASPSCERCRRLGKECGGYRDMTDLIFKDETLSIARRAGTSGESGARNALAIRQPSFDRDTRARQFFFNHFVTPSHLSFLEKVDPDDFLAAPITACGLAAIANRQNDSVGRERGRRFYIDAITATNAALRNPRKVKEDSTLMAVCLLSCYEVSGTRSSKCGPC